MLERFDGGLFLPEEVEDVGELLDLGDRFRLAGDCLVIQGVVSWVMSVLLGLGGGVDGS